MSTSDEAIVSFLATTSIKGPRKLDAAVLFAESMIRELDLSIAQWKATAEALEVLRRENDRTVSRN